MKPKVGDIVEFNFMNEGMRVGVIIATEDTIKTLFYLIITPNEYQKNFYYRKAKELKVIK